MVSLNNIKIGHKIAGGFGIVITMLIAMAVFSYLSLIGAQQSFTDYRALARQANEVGRVQANMLAARLAVKDFVLYGTEGARSTLEQRIAATLDQVDVVRSLTTEELALNRLDEIERDVEDYRAGFAEVVPLIARRDALVGQLNEIGPSLERGLTEIMDSAFADDDVEAAFRAGTTLRNLLLARLYVFRFLDTNDDASYDRVMSELADFSNNADRLLASLEDPRRRTLG